MVERADRPGGPHSALARQTWGVEHAVGQGGRSARWLAFSVRPGSPLQRPLQQQLTLRSPRSPSSSPSGYNRSLTALLSGVSPYLRVAKYSISPSSLQQADATGSGSCPVVSRSLVGPANTIAVKRIAALSSRCQSSRDFCAISIIVWARGPGILRQRVQWPTSSIAK